MSKLSDLFRWKKKVEIVAGKTTHTVWVRLVGDDVYQTARDIATKESRLLRVKLRDVNSDEHIAAFADIEFLTRDEKINTIIFSELPTYNRDAVMFIQEKDVVDERPDEPTLEDQEVYQSKVEEVKNERMKAITTNVTKRTEDRRVELEKLDDVQLLEEFKLASIAAQCMEKFTEVFRDYTVYRAVFSDAECKKLAFSSFDDFQSSSTNLKTRLNNEYNALEMSGEDLKN